MKDDDMGDLSTRVSLCLLLLLGMHICMDRVRKALTEDVADKGQAALQGTNAHIVKVHTDTVHI